VPCFVVAAALPSAERVQQERWVMMKAGLSYVDWSRMAHFQRRDWLARYTVEAHKLAQEIEKADKLGPILNIVMRKLLGF